MLSGGTLASPERLNDPSSQVLGSVAAGQSNWYQLTISVGELSLRVGPSGGNAMASRMTLADPAGKVLIQSDSLDRRVLIIVQYLGAGTYDIEVTALSATGNYQLTSQFVQARQPGIPAACRLWSGLVAGGGR